MGRQGTARVSPGTSGTCCCHFGSCGRDVPYFPWLPPARQDAAGASLLHHERDGLLHDQGDCEESGVWGGVAGSTGSHHLSQGQPLRELSAQPGQRCQHSPSPCLRCLFPCSQLSLHAPREPFPRCRGAAGSRAKRQQQHLAPFTCPAWRHLRSPCLHPGPARCLPACVPSRKGPRWPLLL